MRQWPMSICYFKLVGHSLVSENKFCLCTTEKPSWSQLSRYLAPLGYLSLYHSAPAALIIIIPLAASAREAGVAVRRDADLDGEVPAAGRQVSSDWSRQTGAEL